MKNNRKLLITALSLILCLSVSIGLVWAYFTDYESARGGAVLKLSGQTWLQEDVDEKGKTISIKNVDETDMVVRVMVIGDANHLGVITADGVNHPVTTLGNKAAQINFVYPDYGKPANGNSGDFLCNNLGGGSADTVRNGKRNNVANISDSGTYMRLYFYLDGSQTTVTEYNAWLVDHPITCVYQLAEPVTYSITAPQVRTLLGANNIWADAGPISVEYTADTKTYIDSQTRATRSLIAGIETDLTASRAYAAGDLLIVGDTLYKAAASIASGATLTPGTNVTPTTVAEQLILLANA